MPFREQWRDVKALHDDGIPIDTASNETAKLFDLALTQYTGWYNDVHAGGIEQTLSRLVQSDPSCALARILLTGIDLMGTASPSSTLHSKTVESLGETKPANRYIDYHRDALVHWSKGHFSRACSVWERCLLDYPFDILSIKFVSDGYFFSGNREMLRDSLSRVIPVWENSRDRPLRSYLYGMYGFGLGENNMFERALEEARRGLELNPDDGWATHAIAHSLEYTAQTGQGISFLESTEQQWSTCDVIAPHINWHWALYELEQGNVDYGQQVLADKILKKSTDLIMLDFVDAAALLYRLKLVQGPKANGFFSSKLKSFLDEHLHDHVLVFNDVHMYFLFSDENYDEHRNEFLRSLTESYEQSESENGLVYRQVGRFIFQAIDEFKNGNYAKVVDLLYPIRTEIHRIGGSNAQRDLFSLLLLHSAVHSDESDHRILAKRLINQRSWLKNKTQTKLVDNYANKLADQ